MGISRRFLNSVGLTDDLKTISRDRVVEIYKEYFWEPYNHEKIENVEIAQEVFDFTVLAGPKASGLALQRALRSVSYVVCDGSLRVEEDGIVGPKTVRAVNAVAPLPLLAALKSEQAGYARDLDDPTFERGWVRRAYE